jgi:hypothetical protein
VEHSHSVHESLQLQSSSGKQQQQRGFDRMVFGVAPARAGRCFSGVLEEETGGVEAACVIPSGYGSPPPSLWHVYTLVRTDRDSRFWIHSRRKERKLSPSQALCYGEEEDRAVHTDKIKDMHA